MERENRGRKNFSTMHRKKVCQFCAEKSEYIDFKDVDTLKKYVIERGKILPRRITGTMLNAAKLPSFSVEGESAAIAQINDHIKSEVVAFCDEAAAEPLQYAVADTAVVETDRYLCAVVFYGRPLSVGMDHDTVASYVYDKANDSEVLLDDAFKIAGYDAAQFDSLVTKLYKSKGLGAEGSV